MRHRNNADLLSDCSTYHLPRLAEDVAALELLGLLVAGLSGGLGSPDSCSVPVVALVDLDEDDADLLLDPDPFLGADPDVLDHVLTFDLGGRC